MDLYDELTQLDLQSSLQVLQSSIDALFLLPEVFDAAKFREDIYSNLQNCFVVQEQLFIKHQYYDLTGIKTNDIAADAVAAAATANIPSIAAVVAAPSSTVSSTSASASAAATDRIDPSSAAAVPITAASSTSASASAAATDRIDPSSAAAVPITAASSTSASASAAATDRINPSSAAAVPITAASNINASAYAADSISLIRATAAVIPAAAIDSICDATALTTSSAAATLEPAFSLSQHEVNLGMDVIKRFDECLSQALKADTMLTSLVNNIIEDNSLYNLLKRSEMTLPAFLNKLGKSMLIVFSV
jgi:hypothetical protein